MSAPAPLVPPECSMAGNDFFPFYFDRLRKSKWWRRASDVARARNVMMWGEAYKQQPAGSLPDDDDELAEAAGYGMDVDAFLAAKAEIMAPWVLCSDGRWYHPTVCEVVLDAWERASERKRAAAERQRRRRDKVRGVTPPEPPVTPPTGKITRDPANVTRDTSENGRDFGIQDKTRQDSTEPPLPPEGAGELFGSDPDEPEPADEVLVAFERWNELAAACGLPRAKVLDAGRRRAIAKRLKEGGLEAWDQALAAVGRSPHCRGENDRKWRADLDFVCQPKSWRRLLEGTYGDGAPPPERPPPAAGEAAPDPWRFRLIQFTRNAYWNSVDWGPRPGREGCQAPAAVLREFGLEPPPPKAVGSAA